MCVKESIHQRIWNIISHRDYYYTIPFWHIVYICGIIKPKKLHIRYINPNYADHGLTRSTFWWFVLQHCFHSCISAWMRTSYSSSIHSVFSKRQKLNKQTLFISSRLFDRFSHISLWEDKTEFHPWPTASLKLCLMLYYPGLCSFFFFF